MSLTLPDALRLDAISAADRTQKWQQVLSESYTPVALARRLPAAFNATIRRSALDGISLVECRCDPHGGLRPSPLVRAESEPCIGLQIVLAGRETFTLGDAAIELTPGSAVLWSSRQPFIYRVEEPLHKITLVIPAAELAARVKPEALERGRPVRSDVGVGALLFPMVAALSRQFDASDSANMPAVRRAVIELVVALLADETDRSAPRGPSERHYSRVMEFILDHLNDADLRLGDIARETGVSLRYLHLLFERSGTSVGAWILAARLERCRDALRDPGQTGRSITEIAFAWGFNNMAYFSRAFKRRFGVCPSALRCSVRDEFARRFVHAEVLHEPVAGGD